MKDRFFKVKFLGENVCNGYDKLNLQKGDTLDFLNIMQIVESSYFNFQGGETTIYKNDKGFIIELHCSLLFNYYITFEELENY